MPAVLRTVLVIPCFDEEKRLDLEAFRSYRSAHPAVEFLFVNDGSRDSTLRLLEGLRSGAPEGFHLLDLPQNVGKAEAVRQGVLAAIDRKPDVVGFWDADLATPLVELGSFLEVLRTRAEIAMVFAARVRLLGREISRRPSRHYVGRMGATLISTSLGLAVYDTQCGAKLFRVTPSLGPLFATPFLSRWIFDVEIIARFVKLVGRDAAAAAIYELPVMRWRDVAGSKVQSRDFVRALRDLYRIRRAYRDA